MKRIAAFGAGGTCIAAIALAGLAQAQNNPAGDIVLLDSEQLVATANGCFIAVDYGTASAETIASNKEFYARERWDGDCTAGLAHGMGQLTAVSGQYANTTITQEYYRGRPSPNLGHYYEFEAPHSANGDYFRLNDPGGAEMVSYFRMNPQTLTPLRFDGGGVMLTYDRPGVGQTRLTAATEACLLLDDEIDFSQIDNQVLTSAQQAQVSRACKATKAREASSWGGTYSSLKGDVFYIKRETIPPGATEPATTELFVCPAVTSTAGCDALWEQVRGPLDADMRRVIDQARKNEVAWREKIDDAFRLTQLAAASRERNEARRAAEAERQRAEAQRREADRAAAEKAREEAEFAERLATSNAGQLYALGDEMVEVANYPRARQAFRELISRFPESPLAPKATDRLTAIAMERNNPASPASQPVAAASPSPQAKPAPQGSGGGAVQCSMSPPAALQAFNNDFGNLTSRYPLNPNWGTRDTYQYTMFFSTEGLAMLERYRTCMAPADYQVNRDALAGALKAGRDGCLATTVDPNTCVASYPTNR